MTKEDDRLAALAASADGHPPDLLGEMIGLRKELHNQRMRDWLWRIALIVGVIAALLLWNGQRHALDEILQTRAESRVATCNWLDDMRAKHNDLVQSTIDERQNIIDQTLASGASDAQKEASTAFFEKQIARYKDDLLPIVDCTNPVAVASLFSTPSPGG